MKQTVPCAVIPLDQANHILNYLHNVPASRRQVMTPGGLHDMCSWLENVQIVEEREIEYPEDAVVPFEPREVPIEDTNDDDINVEEETTPQSEFFDSDKPDEPQVN